MPTDLPFALHDWTLVRINYDWEGATATLHVRFADGERELVAQKVTELSVRHSAPWGRSASINQVAVEDSDCLTLKIEMQSGDVISLRAASIELG